MFQGSVVLIYYNICRFKSINLILIVNGLSPGSNTHFDQHMAGSSSLYTVVSDEKVVGGSQIFKYK